MKAAKTKDPRILMDLGRRLHLAKTTMSPQAFEAYLWTEPELRHEASPSRLCRDKVSRLILFGSMPILRMNLNKLPWTGWGTLRELPKLGEAKLRYLFDNNQIGPTTTRLQIDAFRTLEKPIDKPVAPRHT